MYIKNKNKIKYDLDKTIINSESSKSTNSESHLKGVVHPQNDFFLLITYALETRVQ